MYKDRDPQSARTLPCGIQGYQRRDKTPNLQHDVAMVAKQVAMAQDTNCRVSSGAACCTELSDRGSSLL